MTKLSREVDMIDYADRFMQEIGFEDEARIALLGDLKKIYAHSAAKAIFDKCIAEYNKTADLDYPSIRAKAREAGEMLGVHKYSAELLLFICFSKRLRERYAEKGVDDKIWFDSMCDLKWKLWECKAVKQVYGSFVAAWFEGWFRMTRFALGRLQFEIEYFEGEYQLGTMVLTPKTKVLNVHIPRTLTPLDKQSREDSYERAKEFFGEEFPDGKFVFVCHSWLLFPPAENILPSHSNIRGFMADYTIVASEENGEGEHPDMWRLFDMDYTGDVNDYPEDSSLRAAYKKFLSDGNRTGWGYGVFIA